MISNQEALNQKIKADREKHSFPIGTELSLRDEFISYKDWKKIRIIWKWIVLTFFGVHAMIFFSQEDLNHQKRRSGDRNNSKVIEKTEDWGMCSSDYISLKLALQPMIPHTHL